MFQLIKYIIVFFLGCLFIANNPELNNKVISLSESLKNQVINLTGKAARNAEEKNLTGKIERAEYEKLEREKEKLKQQK